MSTSYDRWFLVSTATTNGCAFVMFANTFGVGAPSEKIYDTEGLNWYLKYDSIFSFDDNKSSDSKLSKYKPSSKYFISIS